MAKPQLVLAQQGNEKNTDESKWWSGFKTDTNL